jgi:hypothetical protein
MAIYSKQDVYVDIFIVEMNHFEFKIKPVMEGKQMYLKSLLIYLANLPNNLILF